MHTYVDANPEAVVRTATISTTDKGRTVSGKLRVRVILVQVGFRECCLDVILNGHWVPMHFV